ncbi:hypothetical protein GCM10010274_12340 [Streptomyces lavendofoliae]|uniref:Uncharacterized protein n=1 Tax=Streptomyces lavendofoliae TaxID=67314 RepID=A0A918HVH7_9ACTN|nr:hypothetical protein GCM10010274_12340 [Streptomyces lavendofoliae]
MAPSLAAPNRAERAARPPGRPPDAAQPAGAHHIAARPVAVRVTARALRVRHVPLMNVTMPGGCVKSAASAVENPDSGARPLRAAYSSRGTRIQPPGLTSGVAPATTVEA